MKKLITALALATLAASPAFAATKHARASATPDTAEASEASVAENGNNSYASVHDPYAVFSNDVYAGRDPDPNVRLQMMRDPGLPAN